MALQFPLRRRCSARPPYQFPSLPSAGRLIQLPYLLHINGPESFFKCIESLEAVPFEHRPTDLNCLEVFSTVLAAERRDEANARAEFRPVFSARPFGPSE